MPAYNKDNGSVSVACPHCEGHNVFYPTFEYTGTRVEFDAGCARCCRRFSVRVGYQRKQTAYSAVAVSSVSVAAA